MNWTQLKQKLATRCDTTIEEDTSLKKYTSLGIGGPARLFAAVTCAESAARLVAAAHALKIPSLVLGGGTNLLISDDGFDGLAIHCDFNHVQILPSEGKVTAGATVRVSDLVSQVISESLAGMAFAAGLPGTVGGAVAGNAGCFGSSFGDILHSALILTREGKLKKVEPAFFGFEYRKTTVRENGVIIVEATFSLAPGNIKELQEIAESHLELRRTKHPARQIKTAGSYFKNLPPLREGERRRAAGALLEQVGAKEMSVGDAAVFEKHANILINRGNASARDMLILEAQLKKKVFEAFGVTLEPEVRFIGKRPKIDDAIL